VAGGLKAIIPAKLNTLFKLRDIQSNLTYRLPHIPPLGVIGCPTPDCSEGMVYVGILMKNNVVRTGNYEGLEDLISRKFRKFVSYK